MAALVTAAALAPDASALYVGMYAIGDFVAKGSGGCGSADRPSWPGMVQAWWDHMGDHGHYRGPITSRYKYVDGALTITKLCDTSFDPDCRDYLDSGFRGIDSMDAAILATHGSDVGEYWAGKMRMPNASIPDSCDIDSTEMRLGDSSLEFIHLSSCFSADDDNLPGIRLAMEDPSDSTSSGRRAHLWLGFHGIMWISSGFKGDYHDVAHDGHSIPIANAWVQNLYRPDQFNCAYWDPWNFGGTCQDQCPVAYAISDTFPNAVTRLMTERYNFVYGDPPGNTNYAWMAFADCDPDKEDPWNP